METDIAFIAGIAAGGGALLLIVVVSLMVFIRARHRRNIQDKHSIAASSADDLEAEIHGHKRVENPVFDDRSNTPVPPSPVPSNSGYSPLPSMPPTMSTSPSTFTPVSQPIVEAEEPAPSTEDRAARLKAMREGRQRRRDDEWLLVHQALALIDSLPDENT